MIYRSHRYYYAADRNSFGIKHESRASRTQIYWFIKQRIWFIHVRHAVACVTGGNEQRQKETSDGKAHDEVLWYHHHGSKIRGDAEEKVNDTMITGDEAILYRWSN